MPSAQIYIASIGTDMEHYERSRSVVLASYSVLYDGKELKSEYLFKVLLLLDLFKDCLDN